MTSIRGEDNLKFSVADYVLFIMMLTISAAIGVYYAISGGKQRSAVEYLMGNRQIPVIPVGFSLVASYMSAISYLGVPADVYFYGSMFLWFAVSHVISCVIVGRTFIPVFYRLRITSVYEYLELRFNKLIRRCALAVFYFKMLLYLGVVVYAPCLAFSAVTGFSFVGSIFAVSLVCIFYTTLGGMKAIVWADFFQMLIIIAGMIAMVIRGSMVNDGFQAVWNISHYGGRAELFDINPDPTVRHSVWSMLIGGTTLFASVHGLNQYQVQRFLSLSSLKACHWAMVIYAFGLVVVCILLPVMCGLVAYAHFHDCDPLESGKISRGDQILVYLVLDLFNHLPGLPGLFLSAVFSAALSTFSSVLNALAACTGEDIVKSIWPDISDKRYTLVLKGLVIVFGILVIGMAFLADVMGKISETALVIGGVFGGPLFGIYCLGLFNPKANSEGTFIGFVAGIILGLWISIGAQIYPRQSVRLPLSTAGCEVYDSNVTDPLSTMIMTTESPLTYNVSYSPIIDDSNRPAIASLYSISYLWYAFITAALTVVVGTIASPFIGAPASPDPSLLSPLCESFCCCFGWLSGKNQKKPKKLTNDNYWADANGEPEVKVPLKTDPTETKM